MQPYPFKDVTTFSTPIRWITLLTGGWVYAALLVVLLLLFGPAAAGIAIVLPIVMKVFARYRRGDIVALTKRLVQGSVILAVLGLIVSLVTGRGLVPMASLYVEIGNAIDDHQTGHMWSLIVQAALYGAPFGLLIGALIGHMHALKYNYESQAFMQSRPPTRAERRRAERNSEIIRKDEERRVVTSEKTVRFGVVERDDMAWRSGRHGMIAERPARLLRSGLMVGAAGSGKSVALNNIMYCVMDTGASVLNIDLKDSKTTRAMSMKAAVKAGAKPYWLSMSDDENTTWIDPLTDPTMTPSERAAMVHRSLSFDDSGDAAYYGDQANAWLLKQFNVLAHTRLDEGEGTFDYLYRTATSEGMRDHLNVHGVLDEPWAKPTVVEVNKKDLDKRIDNLRGQLAGIVDSAGHLLRPNGSTPPLDLRKVENEHAMIYIGLSSTADVRTVRVLGAVILRYCNILVSQRMKKGEAALANERDVFLCVDEAGFLGERADAFEELYGQAREAKWWLWAAAQTLSTMMEKTVKTVLANATTRVVLRVNETETATYMSETSMPGYFLVNMAASNMSTNMLGERTIDNTGDSRMHVMREEHGLNPGNFTSIPDHHAYILINLSDTANPSRWNKKDSLVMERWRPLAPVGSRRHPDANLGDTPVIKIIPIDMPTDEELREALNPTLANTFDEIMAMPGADGTGGISATPTASAAWDGAGGARGGGVDVSTIDVPAELIAASAPHRDDTFGPVDAVVDARNVRQPTPEEVARIAALRGQGVGSGNGRGGAAPATDGISGPGGGETNTSSRPSNPFAGGVEPGVDVVFPSVGAHEWVPPNMDEPVGEEEAHTYQQRATAPGDVLSPQGGVGDGGVQAAPVKPGKPVKPSAGAPVKAGVAKPQTGSPVVAPVAPRVVQSPDDAVAELSDRDEFE